MPVPNEISLAKTSYSTQIASASFVSLTMTSEESRSSMTAKNTTLNTERSASMNGLQFKAVIFDLDGTLLDTLQDLANSYNRVLKKMGFPTHPVDKYRYFVGDGSKMCVTRALPAETRDEMTIDRCLQAFRADYAQKWNIYTKPYKNIPEMLTAISKLGLKMAILSNKPHDDTKRCVKKYLSSWKFKIIFGQKNPFPIKPDPFSALSIASQFEFQPEEILFLGDTATDMKTAIAAGMFPVGALWGFRTLEELKKSGAKTTIEEPEELLHVLRK